MVSPSAKQRENDKNMEKKKCFKRMKLEHNESDPSGSTTPQQPSAVEAGSQSVTNASHGSEEEVQVLKVIDLITIKDDEDKSTESSPSSEDKDEPEDGWSSDDSSWSDSDYSDEGNGGSKPWPRVHDSFLNFMK